MENLSLHKEANVGQNLKLGARQLYPSCASFPNFSLLEQDLRTAQKALLRKALPLHPFDRSYPLFSSLHGKAHTLMMFSDIQE